MITPSESGSILSDTIADLIVACRVSTGAGHKGRPKDAEKSPQTSASKLRFFTKRPQLSVDKINTPKISNYFF